MNGSDAGIPRLALRPGPLRRVDWIVLGIVAGAVAVLAATLSAVLGGIVVPIALLLGVLQGGSLVVAALSPRLGIGLHLLSIVAIGGATTPAQGPWPMPVIGMVALVALVAIVGIRAGWRLAALAFAAAMAALLLVVAFAAVVGSPTDGWAVNLTVTASNAAFAVIVVGVVRQLLDARRELDVARTEAETEHARRLWAQERSRIAREMHDVVAHSMSVVHMRATSARFRLPGLDESVASEFDAIGAQARTALAEMRDVLGLLRDDADAPRAPQPGLADLPSLVGATRDAGVDVDIRVAEDVPGLADSAQLALYRVAQESLSNVVRHAPGAAVELALTREGDAAELLIVNGPGTREPLATDSGGHGLRGMRDRIAATGGSLETGPLPDGGFRVRARVPLRPGEGA